MPAAHGTPKPPASDCHGHGFVSPVPWLRRRHDDYRMFIPAAAVGWAKRRRAHGKSSSVIPHPYLVEPEYVREIFGPGPLLAEEWFRLQEIHDHAVLACALTVELLFRTR